LRYSPPYKQRNCASPPRRTEKETRRWPEEADIGAAARTAAQKKIACAQNAKSSARKRFKASARRRLRRAKARHKKGASQSANHREEDFKADGCDLRAYATSVSRGPPPAWRRRKVEPADSAVQSGRGSKSSLPRRRIPEGLCVKAGRRTTGRQGETLMKEGSAWNQPPRIKNSFWLFDDVECSK